MGSARLQKDGVAVFCRLPVHCTDQARETLKGVNSFGWVVPYHTPAHPLGGSWPAPGKAQQTGEAWSSGMMDPSEAIHRNDEDR